MNDLDESKLTGISFDTSNRTSDGRTGYVVKGHYDGVDVAVNILAPLDITSSRVLKMKPFFFSISFVKL